jgi:hypothetical protein
MTSQLTWLSRLIEQEDGALKFLGGTNLSFSGSETILVDGPNLNTIHEFDTNTNGSAHYIIYAECGTDHRETLNASVVAKDNNAGLTVYGRVNTGVSLVNINADITSGKLQLYATPAISGLQNVKVTVFATVSEILVDTTSKATVYYYTGVNGTPKFTTNVGLYSAEQTAPLLTLYKNLTYRFDQSDASNNGNPLVIGTSQDDVESSLTTGLAHYLGGSVVSASEYRNLTRFNASASRYVELTVKTATPSLLFYFSSANPNLGNTIVVADYS